MQRANPVFNRPLEVAVVEGEIVVRGEAGFSGSFTPQAAAESGRRLTAAAEALLGQPNLGLRAFD
jgi:hypothetical protein